MYYSCVLSMNAQIEIPSRSSSLSCFFLFLFPSATCFNMLYASILLAKIIALSCTFEMVAHPSSVIRTSAVEDDLAPPLALEVEDVECCLIPIDPSALVATDKFCTMRDGVLCELCGDRYTANAAVLSCNLHNYIYIFYNNFYIYTQTIIGIHTNIQIYIIYSNTRLLLIVLLVFDRFFFQLNRRRFELAFFCRCFFLCFFFLFFLCSFSFFLCCCCYFFTVQKFETFFFRH